jgi:hypothetical protein
MSELIIRRIKKRLSADFDGLIDLKDVQDRPEADKENHFLTRSLAAAILAYTADLSKADAAKCVTDGFDDNGIDAIYYDTDGNTVYLAQSKWFENGVKSPDVASIKKFISGFKDYIGGKFDRFNDKFFSQKQVLESALDATDVSFLLLNIYTGSQLLSLHATREFEDLLEKENDPIPVVAYRNFGLKEIYEVISDSFGNDSINIDVTLYEWGHVSDPYDAYYGQVSSEEIAKWYSEYGWKLTSRNLRNFKGDTEVNDAMKRTLVSDPGKFWYFNNGITILCKSISKTARMGTNRAIGNFHCEGVSVVNGAQTVGSIESIVSRGFPKAKDARVLVRFISLENCPPNFGVEVTTATNTQNKIERRDFASLDVNQERIRNEMLLDLEKIYVYKSGEKLQNYQTGCDIEEATIALACAYPNVKLAAGAKRNVGILWGNISAPPYKWLFNEFLTASRVWNCVMVQRIVEELLNEERGTEDGYRRRIAFHGNRFILHRVMQVLPQVKFDQVNFDVASIKDEIVSETKKVLNFTAKIVENRYPNDYLNTFFKNGTQCEKLNKLLPELPSAPKIPYFTSVSMSEQQLEMF